MNNKDIEQEINDKDLNAPRVTLQHIENCIASEEYVNFDDKNLTICVLTLNNGWQVTGESACASPENFDIELGKKISRQNAMVKIWVLEGYLLKQKLFESNNQQ